MNLKEFIMNKTGWNFDNSYIRLPDAFYSKMNPNPVRDPKIIKLNKELTQQLGLNVEALESDEGVEVLAGNSFPEGASPLAQAYAGHQFGHFTMLGDGRALLIGEQITPDLERFDIQLKGSGRTPYSRGGDGRAALGPMLREYIISEAMHGLGIPTTRSLAVVETGEPVYRENQLQGAILTRVAASHLRVGTFEYAAGKGNVEDLRALADYAIDRHYPESKNDENPYLSLLIEVIKRQASLIAKWQLVGFIHGVMNTDNMTISGETIDYGPCAFMDTYDPGTVFSSIDSQGRYAYGNQPYIGSWNLARFAESLLPLLHDEQEQAVKIAETAINDYSKQYFKNWFAGMRAKLGIFTENSEDETLIKDLLEIMKNHQADYTNTFRALTFDNAQETPMYGTQEFSKWYEQWQARLNQQDKTREESFQLMQQSNPGVIPRNHRVEEAIEAAVNRGDYSVIDQLLTVLSYPFAHTPEQEEYCKLPDSTNKPYRTFCGT
ncbi:protein adenylyltransferase SelO [Fredinandcohnia sp. 179-A 10B2 NHS]|uniref:protein adenylyltransferase SelO n=1 Tax=Fredinandcohnia sp. 179-A 10B2 NHS TaxID=3235176 RepID=UPI0039A3F019